MFDRNINYRLLNIHKYKILFDVRARFANTSTVGIGVKVTKDIYFSIFFTLLKCNMDGLIMTTFFCNVFDKRIIMLTAMFNILFLV